MPTGIFCRCLWAGRGRMMPRNGWWGCRGRHMALDSVVTLNVYFRGKKVGTGTADALVAFRQDRLGSSVKTFPYGEEKVPNGVDGWKFASYLRDTATNLDYADQRYYANTQGRFMSPDPYIASGGAGDPG